MQTTYHRTLRLGLIATTYVLLVASIAGAEAPGTNITDQTGILSNLNGGPPAVKRIEIVPPKLREDYEVKVNFIKIETSAQAIDVYLDYLNEQARARGEEPGSEAWDAVREMLRSTESEATFEVFDDRGKSVGRAKNLGATTLLRTVKFTANSPRYHVDVKCLRGAGLYHLVFEWD